MSRLAVVCAVHFARQAAWFAASMHDCAWSESQALWQRAIEIVSVPLPPPLLPPLLPPPLLPPPLLEDPPPQALWILPHSVLFTQSIWYWYASFWQTVRQPALSPTFTKLQATSLSHAVPHEDAVAPPPLAGPPPAGFGVMFVRHAGSQIDVPAQFVKTSICEGVAVPQSW